MKALIIGLLSFAVVAAIGAAVVTGYFSPAAPPVFGAAPPEQNEISAKPFASRAGVDIAKSADEAGVSAGLAGSQSTAAPASSLALAPKLEVSEHLGAAGAGSSAELRFKDKVIEKQSEAVAVKKARGTEKLDKKEGSGTVASVHYGVTNRSELMTRANGPVSNFKGRGTKASAPAGQLAGDAGAKLADIQKQLDAAPLSSDDRAKLKKELDPLSKDLEAAVKDDAAQ